MDETCRDFLLYIFRDEYDEEGDKNDYHVEPANADEGREIVQIHVGEHFEVNVEGGG